MVHQFDAVEEFDRHREAINPDIADTLAHLGEAAIESYGSAVLSHNTASTLVDSIMTDGLIPDSPLATPDAADIAFAEAALPDHVTRDNDKVRSFEKFIKGERNGRKPGVFFTVRDHLSSQPFNGGYGTPERLHIFAMEMAMLGNMGPDAPYSDEEKARAAQLAEKYITRLFGEEEQDAHIAVLQANPFSPAIINQRLERIAQVAEQVEPDRLVPGLAFLQDGQAIEGLYIAEPVLPGDLVVTDQTYPLAATPEAIRSSDPAKSRYY